MINSKVQAKCKQRKFFDKWYYIVICPKLCICFSSKSKDTNVSPKHILKLKAYKQAIQGRNFCCVIVKNYLCNVLYKFWIKINSTQCNIKEQTPQVTLLWCGRFGRSSHQCSVKKKVFLKILQYWQENTCVGVSS